MCKAEKKIRDDAKPRDAKGHIAHKMVTIHQPIAYGNIRYSKKINMIDCPHGTHKFAHQQKKMEAIHRFIGSMKWIPKSDDEDEHNTNGTTWIELLMMFELFGYDHERCKGGKTDNNSQKNKRQVERIARWRTYAGKKARKKKIFYTDNVDTKDSTGTIMELFRQIFRYIIDHCCEEDDQAMFKQNRDYRRPRLTCLGIEGHTAAIEAAVYLTCNQTAAINKAVLQQRAGMQTKIGTKLTKSFEALCTKECTACKTQIERHGNEEKNVKEEKERKHRKDQRGERKSEKDRGDEVNQQKEDDDEQCDKKSKQRKLNGMTQEQNDMIQQKREEALVRRTRKTKAKNKDTAMHEDDLRALGKDQPPHSHSTTANMKIDSNAEVESKSEDHTKNTVHNNMKGKVSKMINFYEGIKNKGIALTEVQKSKDAPHIGYGGLEPASISPITFGANPSICPAAKKLKIETKCEKSPTTKHEKDDEEKPNHKQDDEQDDNCCQRIIREWKENISVRPARLVYKAPPRWRCGARWPPSAAQVHTPEGVMSLAQPARCQLPAYTQRLVRCDKGCTAWTDTTLK